MARKKATAKRKLPVKKKVPVKRKRAVKKKVSRKNPVSKLPKQKGYRYAIYTVQDDGNRYYYVGYDSNRGIPVFDTDITRAQFFRCDRIGKSEVSRIIKNVFTKESAASILPLKAKKIYVEY